MKDRTIESSSKKGNARVHYRDWENKFFGVNTSTCRRKLMKGESLNEPNTELCRRMLSSDNIEEALRNVKSNKGGSGVDGVTVDGIDEYMKQHWDHIRELILQRKYKPRPVKRVEIPKDNGGVRLLGVPCVIDRVIQQAMVQVLTPVFEPTFSEYSYGFRPNRSAEDAVRKAQEYMAEGYKHVVDLDLSKFFDMVNHDYLMSLVDKTLKDKDIRRLIYVYLKSGVMTNGLLIDTEMGTPQGGLCGARHNPPYAEIDVMPTSDA